MQHSCTGNRRPPPPAPACTPLSGEQTRPPREPALGSHSPPQTFTLRGQAFLCGRGCGPHGGAAEQMDGRTPRTRHCSPAWSSDTRSLANAETGSLSDTPLSSMPWSLDSDGPEPSLLQMLRSRPDYSRLATNRLCRKMLAQVATTSSTCCHVARRTTGVPLGVASHFHTGLGPRFWKPNNTGFPSTLHRRLSPDCSPQLWAPGACSLARVEGTCGQAARPRCLVLLIKQSNLNFRICC